MEKSARVFAIIKYQQKVLNFFNIFFLHVKMTNKYYQKHKKSFKKKHVKGIKIFLKKEKKKKHHYLLMKKTLMKKIKISYYSLYKKNC